MNIHCLFYYHHFYHFYHYYYYFYNLYLYFYYLDFYLNSIKKLFLNENENNFELFKQKKIWNLFKSKYRWKNFIQVFLNKVSSINKFGLLFKLFPLEAFDLNFTEKILEKFDDRNIINSLNNNLCPNLNEDLYSILKIVIKNRYDVKKYTNIIENIYI